MISRIVFAAGGTGGHIYPAIAVADELRKLNKSTEVHFIGAKGKIEEKIIPSSGYALETIDIRGFFRSISYKNIGVLIKLMKSIKKAKTILKNLKPEIVFGTSGYVSGPVIWAANKLNIPTALIGGDYYPAFTTRILASKVNKLFLNFEETKKYLKRQDNIEIISYPIRENLVKYSKDDALSYFGLDNLKKTLFVFGGSQGAGSINRTLLKFVDELTEQSIQIIWQTGKPDHEMITEKTKNIKGVKALEYIERMDYGYSACDLVVCRSGISTIMEAAYYGVPVIFVPYPFAANNHQEKNARALADAHAARMILDKDLDHLLKDEIFHLMNNDEERVALRMNIRSFADQDAAAKIAIELTKILENSKN